MKNILFVLILTLFFSSKIVAKDFTIQILHFSDLDGNDASILENVSHFSALVNAFKNDPVHGKNTLLLSSGDNLKPGPRFYAGKEKQLKEDDINVKIDENEFKEETLKVIVKDYYFSNVIAKSSKTMIECNNSKISLKSTGTEG